MSLPLSSSIGISSQKAQQDVKAFVFSEKSPKTNYFITDGGIETHMIYLLNHPLREFALFEELLSNDGIKRLDVLYGSYLKNAARRCDRNIILGSPTWRASRDWMEKLGYCGQGKVSVREVNEMGVKYARKLRERFLKGEFSDNDSTNGDPTSTASSYTGRIIIGGDVGPRGDGYQADKKEMTVKEAFDFHKENIEGLVSGGAELIQAITMTYPNEAAGLALAAKHFNVPCSVLFCCEADGRISNGMKVSDAIDEVDQNCQDASNSAGYVAWFGLNCAHPIHMEKAFETLVEEEKEFASILERSPKRGGLGDSDSSENDSNTNSLINCDPRILLPKNGIVYSSCRLLQIRVNASKKTHAELDNCDELDFGDPVELGKECLEMLHKYNLRILGGCCGADDRHIAEMAKLLKEREERETRDREEKERVRKEAFLKAAGGVAGIGLPGSNTNSDTASSSTSSGSGTGSGALGGAAGTKGGQLVRDGELELKLREQRLLERLSGATKIKEGGVEGA
jgi:homocysteine S-methyltransferase